ncbi:hypothetical protein PENSPDRAFT_645740 [Peniophora sp. CONT]|nr:hypothetical protein PENSPDRAFT_645740 [Peniophora sp. CONT]
MSVEPESPGAWSQTSDEHDFIGDTLNLPDMQHRLGPFGWRFRLHDREPSPGDLTPPKSSLGRLWQKYWGQALSENRRSCAAWSTWQDALTGEHRDGDVVANALKHSIISEDDHTLPETSFLPFRDTFVTLRPTKGRVVVRDEYEGIYDAIVTVVDEHQTARGAVVTGQAGCGLTYFMFYCLARKLMAREPVVLSLSDTTFILFNRHGPWKCTVSCLGNVDDDTKSELASLIPKGTWLLLDGDDRGGKIDPSLRASYVFTPVLFSTKHGQYDDWLNSSWFPHLFVMNGPTQREILITCRVIERSSGTSFLDISPHSLRDLFSCMLITGPSLRACLKCLRHGLKRVEEDLTIHIQDLRLSVLEHIFDLLERSEQSDSSSLAMAGASSEPSIHILTRITRRGNPLSPCIQLQLASDWVFNRLLEELTLQRKKQSQNFMGMFLSSFEHRGNVPDWMRLVLSDEEPVFDDGTISEL